MLLIGDPVSTDPKFPSLKYAPAEMKAVSGAFSDRTSVYTASRATPAQYLASQPGKFGIVHFTAHAEANAESPLDSAVILSPDEGGYKLYARDVADRPLSADLVTISACRSAGELDGLAAVPVPGRSFRTRRATRRPTRVLAAHPSARAEGD